MSEDRITADVGKAIEGLENLEKKMAKSYVRKSLRASAKPTLAVAKSTAPERTGNLAQNVKLKSGGTRKGVFKINVGIGKKWNTGPAWYGAAVAFGHKIGKAELGDSRKQVPPNDWIEKAYDDTKAEAVEIFCTTLAELIESGGD